MNAPWLQPFWEWRKQLQATICADLDIGFQRVHDASVGDCGEIVQPANGQALGKTKGWGTEPAEFHSLVSRLAAFAFPYQNSIPFE